MLLTYSSASFVVHIGVVIGRSAKKQVIGANAERRVTVVTNEQSFGYWSVA